MTREEYNKYMQQYYQGHKDEITARKKRKYYNAVSKCERKFLNKVNAYVLRTQLCEYIKKVTSRTSLVTSNIRDAKIFTKIDDAQKASSKCKFPVEIVEIQIKERMTTNA